MFKIYLTIQVISCILYAENEMLKNIKILVFTGYPEEGKKLIKLGADKIIEKSVEEMDIPIVAISPLYYIIGGSFKVQTNANEFQATLLSEKFLKNVIISLILKNNSANEINKEAIKNKMLTIVEDGFIKAKNGITTLEEIMRVTKE